MLRIHFGPRECTVSGEWLIGQLENICQSTREISDLLKHLSPGKSVCLNGEAFGAGYGETMFVFGAFRDVHEGTAAGQELVAMLTMIIIPTLTKNVAQIQDVVTHPEWRGKRNDIPRLNGMSFAEYLLWMAIRHARAIGVEYVELTSRPERAAANRLYQKLGFRLCAEALPQGDTPWTRLGWRFLGMVLGRLNSYLTGTNYYRLYL